MSQGWLQINEIHLIVFTFYHRACLLITENKLFLKLMLCPFLQLKKSIKIDICLQPVARSIFLIFDTFFDVSKTGLWKKDYWNLTKHEGPKILCVLSKILGHIYLELKKIQHVSKLWKYIWKSPFFVLWSELESLIKVTSIYKQLYCQIFNLISFLDNESC